MPDPAQTLDFEQLTTDELLDHLVNGRQAMAVLKAQDEALLDRLSELAEQGELDLGGFTHNDHAFSWSAGRKSWSYPAAVQQIEAQAKAAKKASEADGTATATTGAPFWTIRPSQP
jgi:adenylosuccinate lyase